MICEFCQKEIDGSYGSGRFCSVKCARGFSTKDNRQSINNKVSKTLSGRTLTSEHREKLKGKKRPRTKPNSNIAPIGNLLCEKSKYVTQTVKRRILSENLISYICIECGNDGSHNGKRLTLQLDHINGNKKDHRLINLRFLCPNCHTQTDTYGYKKRNQLAQ
jgi:5-methylcytosine-specific restriction endonuclease McrA